jgi:hypothetical protein
MSKIVDIVIPKISRWLGNAITTVSTVIYRTATRMQRYPLFFVILKNTVNHPSGKLSFLAVLVYLTACTKADVSSNHLVE